MPLLKLWRDADGWTAMEVNASTLNCTQLPSEVLRRGWRSRQTASMQNVSWRGSWVGSQIKFNHLPYLSWMTLIDCRLLLLLVVMNIVMVLFMMLHRNIEIIRRERSYGCRSIRQRRAKPNQGQKKTFSLPFSESKVVIYQALQSSISRQVFVPSSTTFSSDP